MTVHVFWGGFSERQKKRDRDSAWLVCHSYEILPQAQLTEILQFYSFYWKDQIFKKYFYFKRIWFSFLFVVFIGWFFFPLEVGDPHISLCLTLRCVSCDSCISQFFELLSVFCRVLFHFIFVYFSCFWHSLPHSISFYLSILSQLFSFLFPVGNLSAVHYPPLHIFPIINFLLSVFGFILDIGFSFLNPSVP